MPLIALCVDDQAEVLDLLRVHLEQWGYQVITTQAASNALEIVKAEQVDIVITDFEMPHIKGTALAAAIKAHRPGLPVVIFSGTPDVPTVADGVSAWVSKRGQVTELKQTLVSLLNR